MEGALHFFILRPRTPPPPAPLLADAMSPVASDAKCYSAAHSNLSHIVCCDSYQLFELVRVGLLCDRIWMLLCVSLSHRCGIYYDMLDMACVSTSV